VGSKQPVHWGKDPYADLRDGAPPAKIPVKIIPEAGNGMRVTDPWNPDPFNAALSRTLISSVTLTDELGKAGIGQDMLEIIDRSVTMHVSLQLSREAEE
jgi:hypothetical protein